MRREGGVRVHEHVGELARVGRCEDDRAESLREAAVHDELDLMSCSGEAVTFVLAGGRGFPVIYHRDDDTWCLGGEEILAAVRTRSPYHP